MHLVFSLSLACRGFLRERTYLALEDLALRRQLAVYRPQDRFVWVVLSRFWRRWSEAVVIVRPQTVIRWHRAWIPVLRRWKCGAAPGRLSILINVIRLIRRMSLENITWGATRIQAELHLLGHVVSGSTVAKYMAHRGRLPALADISRQPPQPDRLVRFLRGADGNIPTFVVLRRPVTRSTSHRPFQRDRKPIGRVDGTTGDPGVPRRRSGATIPAPGSRQDLRRRFPLTNPGHGHCGDHHRLPLTLASGGGGGGRERVKKVLADMLGVLVPFGTHSPCERRRVSQPGEDPLGKHRIVPLLASLLCAGEHPIGGGTTDRPRPSPAPHTHKEPRPRGAIGAPVS